MDNINFTDKVVVITGAAQGLGLAIGTAFVKCSASVALLDIDQEKCTRVAEELSHAAAGKVASYQCDVGDADATWQVAECVRQDFGKVDVLVSNAGIVIAGGIDEISPEDWERVIRVNLIGFFNVCRAFVPLMPEGTDSNIIQINSKSGKSGSFKHTAYCASKFGGIGAVQSLALELAPRRIRVNAVCPGNLLDSPLWENSLYEQYAERLGMTKEEVRQRYESKVPLGGTGCTYDDVIPLTLFLASEGARYMTGQAINVTGGQEMK